MDEKVLEDIEFHQETASSDDNSPLHLIREKEMEITGRVLTAKREAEDIVAAARKKAVETTRKVEEESEVLAVEQEKKVLVEVQKEIEQVAAEAVSDSRRSREASGRAYRQSSQVRRGDRHKRLVPRVGHAGGPRGVLASARTNGKS